jgi:hypothetical protein
MLQIIFKHKLLSILRSCPISNGFVMSMSSIMYTAVQRLSLKMAVWYESEVGASGKLSSRRVNCWKVICQANER